VTLGNVADPRIATLGLGVENCNVAPKRFLQSEKQTKEGCFACPIGADDRYKLAAVDGKISVPPDDVIRVSRR
jgi:hypothetical protein